MRNALAAVQEARQREKNDPEVNQAQPEEASAPA
jgi:hypothetical protein